MKKLLFIAAIFISSFVSAQTVNVISATAGKTGMVIDYELKNAQDASVITLYIDGQTGYDIKLQDGYMSFKDKDVTATNGSFYFVIDMPSGEKVKTNTYQFKIDNHANETRG